MDVREPLFEGFPVIGLRFAQDEGCRYDVEHLHQIFFLDQISDLALDLLLVIRISLVVYLDGAYGSLRRVLGAVGLVFRDLLQLLLRSVVVKLVVTVIAAPLDVR